MVGINSRARATCSARRRCNEFCQFTEQTRLAASSQPVRKKAADGDAKYSTVTQLFQNAFAAPTRLYPPSLREDRNKGTNPINVCDCVRGVITLDSSHLLLSLRRNKKNITVHLFIVMILESLRYCSKCTLNYLTT